MDAIDILCDLAPCAPSVDRALCSHVNSFEEAVLCAAATGDKEVFKSLPPMLLHPAEAPSAQKLWGGMYQSKVDHANYKNGPAPPPASTQMLLGGAIATIKMRPHPVLLFVDTDKITARIYSTPMAALEADLYAQRLAPSELECKWKGASIASAHAALCESIGAHIKASGLAFMPEYLVSNDTRAYHLVRPGPLPMLYMGSPKTDHEVELIERLIHSELIEMESPSDGGPNRSNVVTMDQILSEGIIENMKRIKTPDCKFETVFELSDHNGSVRVDKDEDKSRALTASKLARIPAIVAVVFAIINDDNCNFVDDQMTYKIQKIVKTIATTELDTTPITPSCYSTNTLSYLTSCSVRLCTICKIGSSNSIKPHIIANSIFGAKDAELVSQIAAEVEGNAGTLSMFEHVAESVDDKAAVLCIKCDSGHNVQSIKLINSRVNYNISIDSAARLLDCPWVITILSVCTPSNSIDFFTIESSGVQRDMLTIDECVRRTHNFQPRFQTQTSSSSATVDFSDFDARLKNIEKFVLKIEKVLSQESNAAINSTEFVFPELQRLKIARDQWNTNMKRQRQR